MIRSIYRDAEHLADLSETQIRDCLNEGSLLMEDDVWDGRDWSKAGEWAGPDLLEVGPAMPPAVQPARQPYRIPLNPSQGSPSGKRRMRRDFLIGAGSALGAVLVFRLIPDRKVEDDGGVATKSVVSDVLRRSLVLVRTFGGSPGSGSGFCIDAYPDEGNSIIATASHVVSAARIKTLMRQPDMARIEAWSDRRVELRPPWCQEEWMDICAFSSPINLPALSLAKELPPIGSRVYAAGFPKGGGFALVEGLLTGLEVQGNVRMITTALTAPGFSGGPVLNDTGEVIGMSVSAKTDGSARSSSVPLHELQNLRERMRFIRKSERLGA